MDKLREDLGEIVLEIRQYLLNTEFAPEPFTEPVDPNKLKVEFPGKILSLIHQHIPGDRVKAVKEILSDSIHLKLIEQEGKPAIEFDDGDIFFQSQGIGELLMHLEILMPDCELPDDIYITPKLLKPPKVKLPPNVYDKPMTKTEELWWDIIEAYKKQVKEALKKAGVEVE